MTTIPNEWDTMNGQEDSAAVKRIIYEPSTLHVNALLFKIKPA